MPELERLIVQDDPEAWSRAGFTVTDRSNGAALTSIGTIAVELTGAPESGKGGITAWTFRDLGPGAGETIDGITTIATHAPPATTTTHANGASRLDHVVMFTPDTGRSQAALEAAGFELRRVRPIPGAEPPRQQLFFWAGETIIEMVGPVDPADDDSANTPASLWGLAVTSDDLDGAAAALGEGLGRIKPAVQKGRRIATLRGKDLGVSVPIAFMSPHQ